MDNLALRWVGDRSRSVVVVLRHLLFRDMSYDQWKTASPYDDEPDPVEEGQRFLAENVERRTRDPEIDRACMCIEELLEEI